MHEQNVGASCAGIPTPANQPEQNLFNPPLLMVGMMSALGIPAGLCQLRVNEQDLKK
jgi:hypothetical protein